MRDLYVLAAHAAGDFPLQTDRMAAEKFERPRVRAEHVAVYTAAFLPVVLASDMSRRGQWVFLATLAGTHFVIDSRRWNDAVPIWFDQALHAVCLAVATALGEWSE